MSDDIVELEQAIERVYPTLPLSQRAAVDSLLADPALAMRSARTIAAELQLSPSVLTRMAQSLGFSGYPDLQRQLQTRLSRPPASTEERLQLTASEYGSGSVEDLAIRALSDELESMTRTVDLIDVEQVAIAAREIASAGRVWVFGARGSASLADWVVGFLRPAVTDCVRIDTSKLDYADQVSRMQAGDVLVIIAFRRIDRVSVAMAQYASRRGAKIIHVGDHPSTGVSRYADVILLAARAAARSEAPYPAAMALLASLVTTTAIINRQQTSARMQALEVALQEFDILDDESKPRSSHATTSESAPAEATGFDSDGRE